MEDWPLNTLSSINIEIIIVIINGPSTQKTRDRVPN